MFASVDIHHLKKNQYFLSWFKQEVGNVFRIPIGRVGMPRNYLFSIKLEFEVKFQSVAEFLRQCLLNVSFFTRKSDLIAFKTCFLFFRKVCAR